MGGVEDAYERFCPDILRLVMLETVKAESVHGRIPRDLQRAALILAEEFGEAMKDVVDLTRQRPDWMLQEREELRQSLKKELVQVASVAMRIIEVLEKEGQ